MTYILGIDPGISTGWAIFREGVLQSAGAGNPRYAQELCRPLRVIIERPQVYRARASVGDPNNLITLAIRVGEYSEHYRSRGVGVEVEHVLPHVWKGTVNPEVLARRVWASLTSGEQRILAEVLAPLARTPLSEDLSAGKRHDVIDAVGICKWSLKRGKGGVF